MLFRLVERLRERGWSQTVVSIKPGGSVWDALLDARIPTTSLQVSRSWAAPVGFFRLRRILGQENPKLLQTWMYHSDLLGALTARVGFQAPIVWGIHHTSLSRESISRATRAVAKLCAKLSDSVPASIICCSEASLRVHADFGYDCSKLIAIENGFDTEVFKVDAEARKRTRQALGIAEDGKVVGLVARWNPQKDHGNFIRAALRVAEQEENVHFILCGAGVDEDNSELMGLIANSSCRECFHLLGLRKDLPDLYNSMDTLASSSMAEAMPLVVGEAMSTAVPCVVTNVGEMPVVVGDTGIVVPSKDSDALASGILEILRLSPDERGRLGRLSRQRVEEEYSLKRTVDCYEQHYMSLLNGGSE